MYTFSTASLLLLEEKFLLQTVLLLILWTTAVLSEYPRFKYRGPHPPPKPPPFPQYAKKWQHPPRHPVRSRPIPVHMPSQHKIPMGVAPSVNRPIALPVRTFWKNTQTTFRTPIEKQPYVAAESIVVPKKVFLSSPAIVAQEYSNNIPTPYKTIKQIGEKGPIHTIPAPNLSPADKPFIVEEVRQNQRQPETTYVQIQKAHQYQVTEVPEQNQKQTFYKSYYDQQQQTQNLQQNEAFLNGVANQVSPNELYQLINAYPQQPQLVEALTVPVMQQQEYLQQIPLLAQQAQALQPHQNFVEQIQKATDKISNQPEYHSFNYEEQSQDYSNKNVKKKELSSLVTAGYNLEPVESLLLARNNPIDSLAQSQYVQNYFDTRDENANNVEPDARPSQEAVKNRSESSGFYVSLPNKEAADTLASLQAAGKINSNLMQLSKKGHEKLPISIYVPDVSGEEGKSHDSEEFTDEEEQNYDDYSQEDLVSEEASYQSEDSFGHRLKPKIN
ncbi:hypothetical protein BDFB_000520 [Asbolus verrucosus]|uniref:Uncharacterized protein n=1 Tax=Asbolus verrucosus TaxID=1661398 RepID=A0A482VST7_ASBVE|nr:hypothetical protein BDFB_000520 [Asbolus verrucosus]